MPDAALIARLAAMVWLHDIGKLHPDFQHPVKRRHPFSHAAAGYGLTLLALRDWCHPLHRVMRAAFEGNPADKPYLAAIFAHHGRPVLKKSYDSPSHWKDVPAAHWADCAEAFARAFPVLGEVDVPNAPSFHHLFAGMVALADWIGSDRDLFPFRAVPGPEDASVARALAAGALRAIGMDVSALPRTDPGFQALTGFTPRDAQKMIGDLPLDAVLVILEAETGSGKTEAALWWFARLFAAGHVTGLYFAVPTRAGARQLHDRVCRAMRRLFGLEAPEPVLAIPGQRVAGDAHGQALPGFVTCWDDVEGPVKTRWAAEHATRFLAATVAVGTVDQALLAGLQVKHAPLRAAALSRSLLVIDEVHASDSYMTAVSQALLRAHLGAGGRAMLMSATLGAAARAGYLGERMPAAQAAVAAPYPALWVPGAPVRSVAPETAKVVRVALAPTMAAEVMAARAIAAAQAGARVLVIRNTVDAAVACWRAVQAAGAGAMLLQVGDGPALHHARFAAEDRALLDAAVEGALGKASPAGGCIVIGSQTLEQSLDLDADFLLTDLCPIDVLLQRIGRLHRHDRVRPEGFSTAQAVVFAPEDGLEVLAEPRYINGLGAWKHEGTVHGIYTDLPVLELTRRAVLAQPGWVIPAMNRALVEGCTHPEHRDALIAERGVVWARYESEIAGVAAAARMLGGMNALDRRQPFPERFLSDDMAVMTRLGEMGPVLDLSPGTAGAFGTPVTRIALPAHWVKGGADEAPVFGCEDGALVIGFGGTRFRYGRDGLAQINAAC